MAKLRISPPVARGTNCPPESEWPKLTAGLTGEPDAGKLLRHAATCDHCGPLLRQALADFAADLTPEEEALLRRLESSRPEWQCQMAARLGHPRPRPAVFAWLRQHLTAGRPIPAWACAAAAVGLAASVVIYTRAPAVENLLATAYTEHRMLELRIPNAAYAPMRLVRGSTDHSRLGRPRALLQSKARIARELGRQPDSPRWLQARGRADLLESNYDSAIAALEKARSLQPGSPALMIDLASAYFERAEATDSQRDCSTAVELLSQALQANPDDPIALFNRAIIYERMHLYDRSIQDWQRYLRVDQTSAWLPGARQRLAEAEQSKKKSS